jgi:asparagine synthase (glutamine-hydrolysing)
MCGLVGKMIARRDGVVAASLMKAMCDRLAHRGPDGDGYYIDGGIGLGHRRLAIIDLPGGGQPIANEDESVWVVLNGEIYNYKPLRADLAARGHRFHTESDTEVLVHLYEEHGESFVDRLHGMFAIALWDARTRTLLLVRDRVGKKPLYYSELASGGVAFASELDALLVDPDVKRDVDPEAVDAYLSIQYVPAPLSIYKAIRKLPAGHVLRCTEAGVTLREYWDVAFEPRHGDVSNTAQWRDELAARLSAVVKERLQSDVPLGAFLSGGLDSSVVVSFMAEALADPVVTCTATFDDDDHDERRQARAVAQHLHCEHHEQAVHPNVTDLPSRMAEVFDEPFADPAAIPNYLLAGAARQLVTVALTGDGGDELFAGYWRHARAGLESRTRRALGPAVASLVTRLAPETRRAGLLPLTMPPAQAYAWKHSGLLFDPELKRGLYTVGFAETCRGLDPSERFRRYYERCPSADPLDRALYVDLKTSLPDGILVKVDRTSMAHGLEVRSPLLDHTLVEFAAGMPASLKLHGRQEKYLLAQVAADRLPPTLVGRPKHGLTIPLGRWLRHQWREAAEDCLFSPTAFGRGLFEPKFVRSMWDGHQAGKDLYTHHLWLLVMLELWHRQQATV